MWKIKKNVQIKSLDILKTQIRHFPLVNITKDFDGSRVGETPNLLLNFGSRHPDPWENEELTH